MRHRPKYVSLLLGLGLLGCDGDSTGPGLGRAEALIQDSPVGAPSMSGSLAGNIHASISSDGVDWVDLGSPNGITVPLQLSTSATTVHGEVDAPGGTYSWVRLVFESVTARLESGSIIEGTTLTNDTDLSLGGSDQQVEVVLSVPSFTVSADPSVQRTVLFDLRSELWLTLGAVLSGTVPDAALQAAIIATTRLDPR